MDWDAMAVVGRIARAHGIRGQVIANLDTDFPTERFRPGATLFVKRDGVARPLTLTAVRFQGGRPVIGVAGVETIDAAAGLVGLELRVPRAELARLEAGTFYRHDLIGCRVEMRDGREVGIVEDVEGTSGGNRLVVAGANGEILIPLAAAICPTIDVDRKRIVIEPPEGLLDLNA